MANRINYIIAMKIAISIATMMTISLNIGKSQVIVDNEGIYYVIKNIKNKDTTIVDSFPLGLHNKDTCIAYQNYIYRFYYDYDINCNFEKYYTLEKYSVESTCLKFVSFSTIKEFKYAELFEAGLLIECSQNGILFNIPDIIQINTTYDFCSIQKHLNIFLKSLCKTINSIKQ